MKSWKVTWSCHENKGLNLFLVDVDMIIYVYIYIFYIWICYIYIYFIFQKHQYLFKNGFTPLLLIMKPGNESMNHGDLASFILDPIVFVRTHVKMCASIKLHHWLTKMCRLRVCSQGQLATTPKQLGEVTTYYSQGQLATLKINMEHNHGVLEDNFPF